MHRNCPADRLQNQQLQHALLELLQKTFFHPHHPCISKYFVLLNIKYHISPSLSSKTAQKGSLETHTNSKQNEKEYAGPHRSDSNFLYFCVHLLGVRIAVVFSGAKKSRHHKDVWIFVLSEGCDITYPCHACAWNCRVIEPNGFDPTYESPKKETIRMDGFFFVFSLHYR